MQNVQVRQMIGERLKAARLAAGMNQRDVATDLGKVQQTIASWESGRQMPDVFDLRCLCTLYAITPNHILLDGGDALPRVSLANSYATCLAEGRPHCQLVRGDEHMKPLKMTRLQVRDA